MKKGIILIFIFLIMVMPSLGAVKEKSKHKVRHKTKHTVKRKKIVEKEHALGGYATWYGGSFHGRKTANDEVYDMYKYTAAHRTLPFGTKVKITNPDTNKSIIVRINDRGPFQRKYFIDLSYKAFKEIRGKNSGQVFVKAEVLSDKEIPEGSLTTDGALIVEAVPEVIKEVTPAAVTITSEAPIVVLTNGSISILTNSIN